MSASPVIGTGEVGAALSAGAKIQTVTRPSVLLDTNTWRYLVDAGAIDQFRKAARQYRVDIVACPAVVYESLRTGNPTRRRALAKALTRPDWVRPMPEAYVHCERLRAAIAVHCPH